MPIKTDMDEFSLGHLEFGVSLKPPGGETQQAGEGCESEGWERALSPRDGFWHYLPRGCI